MLTYSALLIAAFRTLVCLLSVTCLVSSAATAANTPGSFELVVKDSKPLRPGTTTIRGQRAFASRVHGLVPGNADGIEIVFVTTPSSTANVRTGDYAALVLFLDREDKVAQVNLSYVVPGTTVARTVAWKPEDLRKHFSRVTVRAGRVMLKSKGTYSEVESGHDALQLSWDVDVDLPVTGEVTR